MARAGYVPVVVTALLAVIALWFFPPDWNIWVGLPLALIFVLLANFFRDPERRVPDRQGVFAVAPADGRVVLVRNDEQGLQISIFLSVLDVHVNRMPVAGTIVKIVHTPGRFFAAYRAEASTENERESIEIESPSVGRVVCTQVAGLLARRIDNWVHEGESLRIGERYGMIRFGSRVDLLLPSKFRALVREGARVKAGSTPLAEIPRG